MKKIMACMLAVILLMSLGQTTVLAEEPVTLRFSWWGSASRAEVYNAICDAFEAAYPQYKIEREFVSSTAKYMELLAMIC